MPQTSEISPNDFENILKKWPDIFDAKTRKLKQKDDKIWKEIKEVHKLEMMAKSIYFHVYDNRHNSLHNLASYFGIPVPQRQQKRKPHDSLYDPSPTELSYEKDCPPLELNIVCLKTEIVVVEKDKCTSKLGWTDIVADKILEKIPLLPCKYNFKTSWFSEDGFRFKGYCSADKCKCPINGVCESLKSELITIKINTSDCSNIKHDKVKRQLRGRKREEIGNQLLYQTASEYREEKLAGMPKKSEREPVTLSNSAALRKLRQQTRDKLINYQEFKSRSLMSQKLIKHCSIRLLSLNPFYTFSCTQEQIDLWNDLCSKKLPLSFDAIGSLVKKYRAHGIKSGSILYYVLAVGLPGKVIQVMQALSSIHHVLIVLQILKKWLECGANCPGEISTDASRRSQLGFQ